MQGDFTVGARAEDMPALRTAAPMGKGIGSLPMGASAWGTPA
jgi:hypothetical protein